MMTEVLNTHSPLLPRRCTRCMHDLRAGAKFCDQCGAAIAAAVPWLPLEAPRSYTPRHLAERIITSRAAIEGERKQVTVLFADLQSFTGLSEHVDPEALHDLMNRLFGIMLAEVHRYEGTVNQFTGDGIMALFGAPLALEDHAVRAVEAALAIQAAMRKIGDELGGSWGQRIALRIGINTGLVVVGTIGDDLRMDYTAQGETVNLAARFQALTEPGTVAIGATTLRLVAGYFDCESLGTHAVKGMNVSVEVFRPLRRKARRGRLTVAAEGGLSTFVGREAELTVLSTAAEEARAGHGRVVMVIGEAGMGKSRLLWEFQTRLPDRDLAWAEGTCVSYGQFTPYLPVIDILRALLDLTDGDPEQEMERKLTARLAALGPDVENAALPLRYLLAIGAPDVGMAALSPQMRKERLLDALVRLGAAAVRQRPHVFVFENCQWLDRASIEFLNLWAQTVPREHALVILTWRSEATLPVTAIPAHARIMLQPLESDERTALARGIFSDTPVQPDLLAAVVDNTSGNPLFIEEVSRSLRETGWSQGSDALRIPPTVLDVLAVRIDRLPDLAKSALQIASVIGRNFTQRLLTCVVDSEDGIRTTLQKLLELEMIVEKASDEPSYMFRHALLQDVAYQGLLMRRRKALHRRIGDAMAEIHAQRLSEQVEILAHHFLQGEEWEKAVTYLRQAGAKAIALCANTEAVTFLQRALAANTRLPKSLARDERVIDICLDLRPPLLQLGRLPEVLALSREAEALLAEGFDDEPRRARVYTYLINHHYLSGEPHLAKDYGQRSLTIGEGIGDLPLQVLALQYMGTCSHAQGRYRESIQTLMRNIALIEAHDGTKGVARSGYAYVASCGWLAFAWADLGNFAQAHVAIDKACTVDGGRHAYGEAIASTMAGLVKNRQGDFDGARYDLEKSLQVCRERGLAVWQPIPSSILGHTLVRLGRVSEGIAFLEEGVRLTETLGVKAYLALWTTQLGEGLLAAGRMNDALTVSRLAVHLARTYKEEGHQARALCLLGDILARTCALGVDTRPDDLGQAETCYREAADLAARLEMSPLLAQCQSGLAGFGSARS